MPEDLYFLRPMDVRSLQRGHVVWVDYKRFTFHSLSTRVGSELTPPYLGLIGPVHPIAPLRVTTDEETGEDVVWVSHLRCAVENGSIAVAHTDDRRAFRKKR